MFCTNCGKELADNTNFCSNCGAQVVKKNTTPVYEATPVNKAVTTEPKKKFSGISLAGFIVSLASIATLNFIAGIVGLILSRKGKEEIEREDLDGIKFANAGTTLGKVGIIVGAIFVTIMVAAIVIINVAMAEEYLSLFSYL